MYLNILVWCAVMFVPKEQVSQSDLWVGAIYEGGPSLSDEPLHAILGVQNMGGIRPRNDLNNQTVFISLQSTSNESEWPDSLEKSTGVYTYYGDNRSSMKKLLDTDGNKALHRVFNGDFDTQKGRMLAPPFFIFSSVFGYAARSVRFEGLAVPGCNTPDADWCLAKFFKSGVSKFQNYQIKLTILADRRIRKNWVDDLLDGDPLSPNCPDWYSEWVDSGVRIPYVQQ